LRSGRTALTRVETRLRALRPSAQQPAACGRWHPQQSLPHRHNQPPPRRSPLVPSAPPTPRSRLQRSLAALKAKADALCRSNADLNTQAWLVALLLRHCDALVELGGAVAPPLAAPAAGNSSGSCNGGRIHSGTCTRGQVLPAATPHLLGQLLRQEQAAATGQAAAAAAAAATRQSEAVACSGSRGGATGWDGHFMAASPATGLPPLGWRPTAAAATWRTGAVQLTTAALKQVVVQFVQLAAVVEP
jgi:hypothetical protein